MSAWVGGVCLGRGVCLGGSAGRGDVCQTPSLLTECETGVKTLPCRNYVADGHNCLGTTNGLVTIKPNLDSNFIKVIYCHSTTVYANYIPTTYRESIHLQTGMGSLHCKMCPFFPLKFLGVLSRIQNHYYIKQLERRARERRFFT